MKDKILISKITSPKPQNIIERQRLYKLLDKAADRPVTWVSAPAGSGKTTLISSYIDSRKLSCLWYQIDAGDSDLATFFYYMGLAAKKANPRKRKPMPFLTPEYLAGIPIFTRRYFEELYSRVVRQVSRVKSRASKDIKTISSIGAGRMTLDSSRFVVVFDNYQEVSNPQFHEMIVNGIDVIPERIRVVIISRTEAPAQFSRIKANRKVGFIGWNEMRFNEEEIRQMVLEIRGEICQVDSCPTVKSLKEKTDGWAAGITLILSSAERQESGITADGQAKHCILPQTSGSAVFDYFASEVFEKSGKQLQSFLLKTSFLPFITTKMAEDITETHDAQAILSELSRSQYFTDWKPAPDPFYQYHPLFREFLIARAASFYNYGELLEIKQKAAVILEESGHIEAAVEIWGEIREFSRIAGIILVHGYSMLSQGRNITLDKWFSILPEETIDSHPQLLYLGGLCRLPFDFKKGRAMFEKAFHLFKDNKDYHGALLACAGVMEVIVIEGNDYTALDGYIEWLDEVIRKGYAKKHIEAIEKIAGTVLFALTFRNPWHSTIAFWRETAEAASLKPKNLADTLKLCNYLMAHYMFFGKFNSMSSMMKTLLPLKKEMSAFPMLNILSLLMEAFNTSEAEGDCAAGAAIAMEGLERAHSAGIVAYNFWLSYNIVLASIRKGDVETAASFLDQMLPVGLYAPAVRFADIHYLTGALALRKGVYEDAVEHFNIALDIFKRVGNPISSTLCTINLSRAFTSKGDFSAARLMIDKALGQKWGNSQMCEYQGLLTEALLSIKTGHDKAGIASLRKALCIGRENGIMMHTFWDPSDMSFLCARALEAGIEPDFVKEHIRRHNLTPPESMSVENWPYLLKIHTLGRFEIIKNNELLVFTGKIQQKPLELLKAVIAFGGLNVPETKLCDKLWPDSDGDSAHKALEIALIRLRGLLDDKSSIKYSAGQVSIDTKRVWIDSLALRDILDKLNNADNESLFLELCDKAVALYNGRFLSSGSRSEWTVTYSEMLQGRLLRAITKAGGYCEQKGNMEKAAEYYQKGIEIDELAEGVYQRLMLCYNNLGRRAEAVSLYDRCRRMLSTNISIEPSDKTKGIYFSITQKP